MFRWVGDASCRLAQEPEEEEALASADLQAFVVKILEHILQPSTASVSGDSQYSPPPRGHLWFPWLICDDLVTMAGYERSCSRSQCSSGMGSTWEHMGAPVHLRKTQGIRITREIDMWSYRCAHSIALWYLHILMVKSSASLAEMYSEWRKACLLHKNRFYRCGL